MCLSRGCLRHREGPVPLLPWGCLHKAQRRFDALGQVGEALACVSDGAEGLGGLGEAAARLEEAIELTAKPGGERDVAVSSRMGRLRCNGQAVRGR
jgi:hypothetical protein